MNNDEVAKICADAGLDFSRIKQKLGLSKYAEHIMEGGDGIHITYR